jgi:hypothetical protein
MGIFSSKTVITVGTAVARVIEDEALPDSIYTGFTKGTFSGDGQLVENVMEDLSAGMGVRASRAYQYGKKSYVYGVPSGAILESTSGKDVMSQVLQGIHGQTATVSYYHFGAFNNLHVGWVKLISDHGYVPTTNVLGTLSAAQGKTIYLANMAVVVTEASLLELANGSLDQWGAPANSGSQVTGNHVYDKALRDVNELKAPTLFELDPAAVGDYLRVDYTWLEDEAYVSEGVVLTRKVQKYGSFRMDLAGYDTNKDYHQVRYTLANGSVGYRIFEDDKGEYPALDALYDPQYSANGQYFPFTYFRYEKVNGAVDKTTQWFKNSKRLLNTIGMDYEQVANAIDENPDIGDVEQAMMIMAVPANTKDQNEMRYLHDYFKQLLGLSAHDTPAIGSPYTTGLANTIVIQDKRFKMTLGYSNITRRLAVGKIAEPGQYTFILENKSEVVEGIEVSTVKKVFWNTSRKVHVYCKQINLNQYEEVKVYGLNMKYHIFQQYSAVGDEDDTTLLIPIDMSIVRGYSLPIKENLYSRAMQYVFNSKVVTKVKWYQQGWFRYFMLIVAIVVTVMSYGSTWQAIGAALSAGTITIGAVVYMIAIGVLKMIVIGYVLKLFVRLVGPEFAFIVAIAAAMVGAYQAVGAGSIAGAPWAKELLALSTGLTKGINVELGREFGKLQADSLDFKQYMDYENERLEKANDLLKNDHRLNPMVIFGESPTQYYNRTVHSGNIGVLGITSVEQYFDVSLQLPKLTETL